MKKTRLGTFIVLGALLFAPYVIAEEPCVIPDDAPLDSWKEDNFKLRLGGFLAFFDTDVRIDGNGGRFGTSIDLESELNLDRVTLQPRAGLEWRITRRQRLELSYHKLRRSAVRRLSTTINVGDESFTFGTNVHTVFDVDLLRLGYRFSFIADERKEFGVTLGIFAARAKLGIETQRGLLSEFVELELPLPSVGIGGMYRLREKWSFSGRAEYFYLEIGDYEGDLTTGEVLFERQLSRHTSFGFGYSAFLLDLDQFKKRHKGNLNFFYHGPTLFFGLNF